MSGADSASPAADAPEPLDPVDAAYAQHCAERPPPAAGVPGMLHAHYVRFVDRFLLARAAQRRADAAAGTPEQMRGRDNVP